jgi:Cu+-exporting ATPase
LTEGKPAFNKVLPAAGFNENEVLQFAASLEQGSEHPFAHAIINEAKQRKLTLDKASDFESSSGIGIHGRVNGQAITLGSAALMQQEKISYESFTEQAETLRREGASVIYLAANKKLAGLIAISDPIKSTTMEAVQGFKKAGIHLVMATGDGWGTARSVGIKLGIDEVMGEVKPQDKVNLVARLQKEQRKVAMAGDGINDAPALARADVGIAMGTGTDVAMNSGHITLIKGDLRGILRARALSSETVINMKQNLSFALIYNALGIPIAAGVLYPFTGLLLSPLIAALAMSFSSVSVVGNALRLRNVG